MVSNLTFVTKFKTMIPANQLIHLNGLYESMMLTSNTVKLIGKRCADEQAFNDTWSNGLPMTRTLEIRFSQITGIEFELIGNAATIQYNSMGNLPVEQLIIFVDPQEHEMFVQLMESTIGQLRYKLQLSSMNVVLPLLVGAVFSLICALHAYYEVLKLQEAGIPYIHNRRDFIFKVIAGNFGPNVMMVLSLMLIATLLYMAHKSYQEKTYIYKVSKD